MCPGRKRHIDKIVMGQMGQGVHELRVPSEDKGSDDLETRLLYAVLDS
jgi:hypothetical protein